MGIPFSKIIQNNIEYDVKDNVTSSGDELLNALNKLNHKKILVVGDSLSDNDTYPPNWLDKAKTCIQNNHLDITINTDLCIDGSSYCGFANELNVFDAYTNEFDIVLICLGFNDYQGQFYCGKFSDTSLSAYGTYNLVVGIKNVLEKIRTKFPKAKQYGVIPTRSISPVTTPGKPLSFYRYVIGTTLQYYGARIIDWSSAPLFAPAVLGTFNDYTTSNDKLHPQSAYAETLASYTFDKLANGGDSNWKLSADTVTIPAFDGTGAFGLTYYSNGLVHLYGREQLASAITQGAGTAVAIVDVPREICESFKLIAAPNAVFNQSVLSVVGPYSSNTRLVAYVPTGATTWSICDVDIWLGLNAPANGWLNIID